MDPAGLTAVTDQIAAAARRADRSDPIRLVIVVKYASEEQVEEIMVKMMRPQIAARSIFRRLGFHEETLLPDYVKDLSGQKHDLILMRCDLEAPWEKMEDAVVHGDWQRGRS